MNPFAAMLLEFWSIYLHLFLFFTSNTASALSNDTDHLALLTFKKLVSNDPHNTLASWNNSNHFCNWHGIKCSRRHERVTELNLNGYGLYGVIAPHIGNLSFLRNLSLQNNSFYGEIPQEFGRLFRLQQLALTNNSLTGVIPINLTSCTKLKHLYLPGNKLTGIIPAEIGSLTKLENMSITTNGITGKIPASLWNLSSLVYLSVGYNNLEGNISEDIGRLRNLKAILILGNNLSGVLPSSFYNISSLTWISVAENQFEGSFPANMFLTLPALQKLSNGMNHFSGTIPASITNASMLQMFDISDNHFVGKVPSLGNHHDLWRLNLELNNLGTGSNDDLDFIASLKNCSKLKIFSLSSNNFGGHLANSIGNLSTQLQRLYLGGNHIYGTIPTTIGNFINLILLDLDDNHFVGTIPTTFEKLQNMQLLSLAANKLSGVIPTFIDNLTRLVEMDLSVNMLTGNIPPSIGNCQNLQYLSLSHNKLSGLIPSQVFRLSSLSLLLNLSQNSFTGNLPTEIGNLKNIGTLDVSDNNFVGDIPRSIGYCITLEYLNLQGNSFHGIIPLSLVSLRGLQHLDLSRNNLSGSIPKGLKDLPMLKYLNISFNMLDGEVPIEGVFRNSSSISVIGNAGLCGGVSKLQLPPCPMKLVKHKKNLTWKLTVVIVSVALFFVWLSIALAYGWMKKTNRNLKWGSTSLTVNQFSMVSYHRIHQATNGFSPSNMIGSGCFGVVYKGILDSENIVVAIKVLNLQKKGAKKSFIAECNALRNIRHRNLVEVLTCCSGTDYMGHEFKALVFEYMENGSLENWLHSGTESEEQPRSLDLEKRLNIVNDIASALHYLHYECEEPIIHCDLKPANVLLDNDMVAHVSDFGLARILSSINDTSHLQTSTIGIKGTIGYAPPGKFHFDCRMCEKMRRVMNGGSVGSITLLQTISEYGMSTEVTTQGDVYSFGILMLEMFTGRRPTDEIFKDGQNLHGFVKVAFSNNLLQIVDPTLLLREVEATSIEENREKLALIHPKVEQCLVSLLEIGLACSVESPKERINVMDVTKELNHIKKAYLGWNNGLRQYNRRL